MFRASRPSLRFAPAEQVASLRSPAGCPDQRSGTGSSLLRTPPTSVVARAAFSVAGVAPPVESSLLAMTDLPSLRSALRAACGRLSPLRSGSPLTRASLPNMSPTQTPPVHCRSPRRLIRAPTLRPSPKTEKLGCRELFFRGSFVWFMGSLRPVGSTPCLLPTPPHGDAVGTVFGAEPSNCTDGTFTRVDARFTGAPSVKS